jgi:hypothetical protein
VRSEQGHGSLVEPFFKSGKKIRTLASGFGDKVRFHSFIVPLNAYGLSRLWEECFVVSFMQIPMAVLTDSSSAIIHDLQQRCYVRVDDGGGDILIYHYFSHREGRNQQAEPMLRSCIAQAGFCGVAKALIVKFYNKHHISFLDVDPSLDEFTMFFFEILKILSIPVHAAQPGGSATVNVLQREIYIVLDALDEIPFGSDRDEVLRFVQALRNRRFPNLHLLLTSRVGDEEHDIASMLDQAGEDRERAQENSGDIADNSSFHSVDTLVDQLPLVKYVTATEDIKGDVELVVQKELRTHRRLKSLQQDLKDQILKSLVQDKQPVYV